MSSFDVMTMCCALLTPHAAQATDTPWRISLTVNRVYLPLHKTLGVTIYTVDGLMPVYSSSFARNLVPFRSLAGMRKDFMWAGMKQSFLLVL